MLGVRKSALSAGAPVRVRTPGPVPEWSEWEPCQRTSTAVKRRLQELFFKGDKRVHAQIIYVGSEAERDRLKLQNRAKVQLRDAAGNTVVAMADLENLQPG